MMQADKGMRAGDNGSGADQTGVAEPSVRLAQKTSGSPSLRHNRVIPRLVPKSVAFGLRARSCLRQEADRYTLCQLCGYPMDTRHGRLP